MSIDIEKATSIKKRFDFKKDVALYPEQITALRDLLTKAPHNINEEDKQRGERLINHISGHADIHINVATMQDGATLSLLQLAVTMGHAWAVKLLIERGVLTSNLIHVPDKLDAQGNTIYTEYSLFNRAAQLGQWEVVDMLMMLRAPAGKRIDPAFLAAVWEDNQTTALDYWLSATVDDDVGFEKVKSLMAAAAQIPSADGGLVTHLLNHSLINHLLFRNRDNQINLQRQDEIMSTFVAFDNLEGLKTCLELGMKLTPPPYSNVSPMAIAIAFLSPRCYEFLQTTPAKLDCDDLKASGESSYFKYDANSYNPFSACFTSSAPHALIHDMKDGLPLTDQQTQLLRKIIRKFLEEGFEPSVDAVLQVARRKSDMNRVFYEEGFEVGFAGDGVNTPLDTAEKNAIDHGQSHEFYAKYHDSYHALFEAFTRENPFLSGTMPKHDLLSDHPLNLIHAFSAIGKLKDAFEPRYWPGAEGVLKRTEVMAQLYPYQQRQLGIELVRTQLTEPSIDKRPLGSWTSAVLNAGASTNEILTKA